MAVKKFKPTSAGRRFQTMPDLLGLVTMGVFDEPRIVKFPLLRSRTEPSPKEAILIL